MKTKQELHEAWQCFSSECGDEDPNTKQARHDYFLYCDAEEQTIKKCVVGLMHMLRYGELHSFDTNEDVYERLMKKLNK